jgi:protein CpxP
MRFFQKRGFKRGLLALTGIGLIAAGLSACGHHRGHADFGSDEMRAKVVAKVGSKLDLDAVQKQKLDALVQTLAAQRLALMGERGQPAGQALQGLMAGPTFDRERAQALADSKTAILREKAPELIAAVGAFYDALKPAQQQELRDYLSKHRHS